MSLVVAYLVTPILGEWFAAPSMREGKRSVFDRLLDALRARYVPLATASLHRPWITVALAVSAVAGAVLWMPHLGVQFFPSADRAQFFIDVNAPDGTDIRTTSAIADRIETVVRAQDGVTVVGAFVGAGAPRFFYNVLQQQPKPSYAQILVDTADIASANRLVNSLGPQLRAAVPGARIDVKKLEQGPPVGSPIQLRLQGEDPAALASSAAALRTQLALIPGTVAVRDSLGQPTTTLAAPAPLGAIAKPDTRRIARA